MGILIRCNDVSFTNYVGIADYPIIPSLKNLYYMGGTEAKTLRDHSGNGNNGTIAGTVTINANSATFSGTGISNKITAQNPTSGGVVTKMTAIALVKKSGKRGLVSNGAGASAGFCFGTARALYYSSGSMQEVTYSLSNSNNFYIMALVIDDSAAKIYVSYKDRGLSVLAQNNVGNVSMATVRPVNFGGTGYNWAMDDSADIAVAAYYEDALTTDQLNDAISFIRMFGENKGLSIN